MPAFVKTWMRHRFRLISVSFITSKALSAGLYECICQCRVAIAAYINWRPNCHYSINYIWAVKASSILWQLSTVIWHSYLWTLYRIAGYIICHDMWQNCHFILISTQCPKLKINKSVWVHHAFYFWLCISKWQSHWSDGVTTCLYLKKSLVKMCADYHIIILVCLQIVSNTAKRLQIMLSNLSQHWQYLPLPRRLCLHYCLFVCLFFGWLVGLCVCLSYVYVPCVTCIV